MYGMSIFRGRNSEKKLDDDSSRFAKVSELRDALGPLNGRTLQYCNEACLKRYLEARNWNVDKAKKMLEESIKWRATYKPEEIRWHEVAQVGETGLISKANFQDRDGRSVLIMRPGMQKTKAGEGNLRHLVYLSENVILNLPEDKEQMTWLIDFTGWTMNTNVPISVARDIINVLQNHYPERLGEVILYNPPRIFEAFWKAVKLFVDAKTSKKMKFVYPKRKDCEEVMNSSFDIESLPVEFGGKVHLKYNHEELCREMAMEDVKTAKFWQIDPVLITA
ncbi:phosphatidylinositol transfer protein 3-like [Impatiens glandulifera]|uniref:phosphatidylinositol transfer protein 3-like n=1 Tax=Impatiens glandulifera TaxID=253017 RepID=UPI001FB0DFA4|nr:phosphatidylinositol transfer protein 3-like [Impatiens glandulifera]